MSWQTIYNNVTGAIAQQMQSLSKLQEQVSTGERVNRASDDPVAAWFSRVGALYDGLGAGARTV